MSAHVRSSMYQTLLESPLTYERLRNLPFKVCNLFPDKFNVLRFPSLECSASIVSIALWERSK